FNEVNEDKYTYDLIPNVRMFFVDETLRSPSKYDSEINDALKEFKKRTLKQLSLFVTFHYFNENCKSTNDEELLEHVRKIKPLFSKKELMKALEDFKGVYIE
ncbi:unnamed protein product, partial [marine sediment metagenome]